MNNFSFSNIFKDKFLENFTNTISMSTVTITMLVAFIFCFITYFVYKMTCDNVVYSKKFNITMSLMSLITTAVVMSMQANVVVSLGMVGALSIIRFRTAIKEPKDLLFLFWSVSNGIIIGAGIYSVALMLAIILTIGLLVFEKLPENKIPYLLVVSLKNMQTEKKVCEILEKNNIKFRIKSRNATSQKVDIIYEISGNNVDNILNDLTKINSVISSNIITQDGECQF